MAHTMKVRSKKTNGMVKVSMSKQMVLSKLDFGRITHEKELLQQLIQMAQQ